MKKLLVGVALLMALVPALVSAEMPVVKYGVPMTIAAAPAYVAMELGLWKKAGVDVQVKIFSSGRQALDGLLSNSLDMCSMAESPPMHAVVQGHKICWIVTVSDHAEAKFTYRPDTVKDPTKLEGLRIATLPGTNSDYYMYEYFKRYGIDSKKVKLTSMKPPNMVTAFVAGDLDGYFAWEPHNYYGKSKTDNGITLESDLTLYHGYMSIMMQQKFVDANKDTVKKVIEGFILAEKYIAEYPAKARAIVSKVTRVPVPTLEALWDEFSFKVHLTKDLITLLEKQGAWSRGLKGMKTPINWRSHIYYDGLISIDPKRVE
jgi:ABC-type nitrate/sulfonate/bicarbonate transport system substrate-binding protein